MELVMFCHPTFMASQSMPRFAQMLKAAYEERGHRVQVWSPRARLCKRFARGRLSKWAGYVDQYVLFPRWVRKALRRVAPNTLFVFCDQALGPWVPLVAHRPHVVHAHDLLALRSALGGVPENPTSLTGRIYQRYIRRGFRRGRHFISISRKTRDDLHSFGQVTPLTSEVVYNGLNFPFAPLPFAECERILRAAGLTVPAVGVILHVGGGQWYKNLPGVIALYGKYAARVPDPKPLWCVSPQPNAAVKSLLREIPPNGQVRFLSNLHSRTLQALYSRAAVLLFPSLAEGFGWPLIEAQACGCPVITTDEPPMNEVAGKAARCLPRLNSPAQLDAWADHGATVLQQLLAESPAEKARRKEVGQAWVKRFDADQAIDGYLAVYQRVLELAGAQREASPAVRQNERV
jgi:glycosyltransferase involved in cell wall biosynthesis